MRDEAPGQRHYRTGPAPFDTGTFVFGIAIGFIAGCLVTVGAAFLWSAAL